MRYPTVIKARADLALTSSGEQTRRSSSRSRKPCYTHYLPLLSTASAVLCTSCTACQASKLTTSRDRGSKQDHTAVAVTQTYYISQSAALSTFPFLSLFRLPFAIPTTPILPLRDATARSLRSSPAWCAIAFRSTDRKHSIITIMAGAWMNAWVSQLADLQF